MKLADTAAARAYDGFTKRLQWGAITLAQEVVALDELISIMESHNPADAVFDFGAIGGQESVREIVEALLRRRENKHTALLNQLGGSESAVQHRTLEVRLAGLPWIEPMPSLVQFAST